MADAPVTLVSGFGRCGTSMVMQMLRAGGMPVMGDWPAFEVTQATVSDFDAYWVSGQDGAAVKVLDLHKVGRHLGPGAFRTIWLDRNTSQQALSHAKFLRITSGLVMTRRNRRRFERSLRSDRPAALREAKRLGNVMILRFGEILEDPYKAAVDICLFTGLTDPKAMASAVRPRSPVAMLGMDLEEDLAAAGAP